MKLISIHTGSTRLVVCVGGIAFKFPRLNLGRVWRERSETRGLSRMFRFFRAGMQGNVQEIERYFIHKDHLDLCPCKKLLPYGLLTIADRCEKYISSDDTDERMDAEKAFEARTIDGYLGEDHEWYTNDLAEWNLGWHTDAHGTKRLVRVDYADLGSSSRPERMRKIEEDAAMVLSELDKEDNERYRLAREENGECP